LTTKDGHDTLTNCVANAGYYGTNEAAATACPVGTFKLAVGQLRDLCRHLHSNCGSA
jgi:hypothetical protein